MAKNKRGYIKAGLFLQRFFNASENLLLPRSVSAGRGCAFDNHILSTPPMHRLRNLMSDSEHPLSGVHGHGLLDRQ